MGTIHIPIRVIQTLKNRDLPPLAKAAATNLNLLHPDWKYLSFDHDDTGRFDAVSFCNIKLISTRSLAAIERPATASAVPAAGVRAPLPLEDPANRSKPGRFS